MLDAIRAYEEGVGSIDGDRRGDEGRRRRTRWARSRCADFVGLDTLGSICDVMFDEFRERRFAQPPTLRKMLARRLVRPQVGHGLLRLLRRGAGRDPGV